MFEKKQLHTTAVRAVVRAFPARVSSSPRRSVHRAASALVFATLICAACAGDSGPQLPQLPPLPPPPTAKLQPSDTTVFIGQKLQLSVVVLDHLGQTITVPSTITWRSSNDSVAQVSATGVVTGVAIGTATMSAACCGATATATIVVKPVEPIGATSLNERAFNAKNEAGWYDDTYRTGNLTFIEDPTAPKSPNSVAQVRYPAGFEAGAAPADNNSTPWTGRRTLYLVYWAKYSENFYGQSADNKQVYIWDETPSVYTTARGFANGTLRIAVVTQSQSDNKAYDANMNTASANFTRNVWHKVELVLVGNTSGASDGSIDFWLDGEQVGHYTGIRFATGADTWQWVQYSPNWGGGGGTVPADQYMWMDHLRVSGM